MKTTKFYNQGIEAPVLKSGETRYFRILGIHKDQDHPGRMIIPANLIVPSRDTILHKDKPVDIACIKSITGKGDPVLDSIVFSKERLGVFTVNGSNILDRERYSYLMMCNYRSNNESRDKTKPALFELVDPIGKAKTKTHTRAQLLKALTLSDEMSDEAIVTYIAAHGGNTDDSMTIMRNVVGEAAEKDPVSFVKSVSNRDMQIKATASLALKAGVIKFNKASSSYTWGTTGETIVNIPRSSHYLDGFLGFVKSNNAGESVYQEIVNMISDNQDQAPEMKGTEKFEEPNIQPVNTDAAVEPAKPVQKISRQAPKPLVRNKRK